MIDKNFYNEASASKLGWDPTWFGEKHFDDDLIKAIITELEAKEIKSH